MTLRSCVGVVPAFASVAILAGCGGGGSGSAITADGSSTVGPFTTKAAEDFKAQGGGDVTVGISGTGGGFERFCAGETDISNASRPIKDDEAAICAEKGVEYVELQIATDALTNVINSENDWVKCLTVDQLNAIWEPGSKVNNWKDVRAGFPDVPLKLFGPGTDSGTFDYFTEAINGRARASRSDYQASEDDNVLVTGVSGERGGMAYFGFSYFTENQSRLNAIQITNPKTSQCVAPSKASVFNNSYRPLARPLFIYAKGSSFKRQEVQAFLDYIFDNEVAIANRSDFISLTPKQLKRARTNFILAVKAANRT